MSYVYRYELFIAAALFSSRKPLDTPSVTEMSSPSSPPDEDFGISCATLF